jgi:hypothetical protein
MSKRRIGILGLILLDGQPVRTMFYLPIQFKLTQKKK